MEAAAALLCSGVDMEKSNTNESSKYKQESESPLFIAVKHNRVRTVDYLMIIGTNPLSTQVCYATQ